MAAVTQKVPNFLGGVSTQPDEVKNPGQVREVLNGFPDPATGLLKRQGTQFVAELKSANNAILTPSSGTTNGKWLSIFRDNEEQYIAVVRNGSILVWDALTGSPRTVTYDSGTTGYISSASGSYEVLSVYDKTFIVNKEKVVAKLPDPVGVATDRNATIVLRSVEYSASYTVTINPSGVEPGTTYSISVTHNGLPVRGHLYVPNSPAAQLDVVALFHPTIETEGVTPLESAEQFLTTALDPDKLNLRDKILFAVAYPQDNIPGWTQAQASALFPGINLSTFVFGDNIAYAEAALLWAKNALGAFLTTNNTGKTIGKLFTFGHSQGGLLVHRLNTMHTVDGVIANAPGPIDLLARCQFSEANGDESPSCLKIKTIHGSTASAPAKYNDPSLKSYLTGLLSPMLFTQALNDTTGNAAGVPQVTNMQTVVQPGIQACVGCAPSTFKYYTTGGHAAFATNSTLQQDVREFVSGSNIVNYSFKLTTRNADGGLGPTDPPKEVLSAEQVLTSLKNGIEGLGIPGLTVTKFDNSLELVRTSGFGISAKGGQSGDAIEAFQFVVRSGGGSSVSTLAKLPEKSIDGRLVKVANFSGNEDDFFVRYIAAENTWEETISPTASPGLDPTTMPHALIRNPNGSFTLKKVDWEPRLVGDDVTNDHPSLVGRTVDALFFHANRFGLLAGESVVMSQAGDYFNLYAQSALTQVDSDPIDINVSSIKPTKLHAVLPKTTGLVLFSGNQQFLLKASEGIYSPNTVTVNSISSYENEVSVKPVDMGVTIGFLSKSKSFTRFFEMQLKGEDDPPSINEVSKVVSEWIPETIDRMVSSAQNSLMALSSKGSKDIYTLRFYTENVERQIEAWTKWRMIGEVIHIDMYEDVLFIVTKQADRYWFQTIDLVQSPTTPQLVTPSGAKADPRLDMWSAPVSKVYNSSTKKTKIVLPYKSYSGLQGRVVVSNATNVLDADQGLLFAPTLETNGSEWFYQIDGNFSSADLVVGYAYNFEVELPKIYWRTGENQTDFTASLTIARTKFSVGLSGDMVFELNVRGRSSWFDFDTYRRSDYYIANTVPFDVGSELIIPIHQRNNNYTLKVTSDTPYPVSLISMTWEGMYSPRYYRRS